MNNLRMALIALGNLIELYTDKPANLDLLIGNGSRVLDYKEEYIAYVISRVRVEVSCNNDRLPPFVLQLGTAIQNALTEGVDTVELP